MLLAPVLLCAVLGSAASSDGTGSEYQLKAAFLYNFTKYVKWPERSFESATSPIVVAVVGQDPFGRTLDEALHDKTVGTRKLEVRRFKGIDDLAPCQLLFVSAAEAQRLQKIREHYAGSTTLLVGDTERFAGHGGAIGFYIEEKKVRFEVNPEATKRAELDVSSQLLKLARIVKEEAAEH